jgi:hypothetical protein
MWRSPPRRTQQSVRVSIGELRPGRHVPWLQAERTTSAERVDRPDGPPAHAAVGAVPQFGWQNRPAQGYGADNVMWQFLWFGRQVDTGLLKDRLRNPDGTQFNWNNRWNNNPYWTATSTELGQPRPHHRQRIHQLRRHAVAERLGAQRHRLVLRTPPRSSRPAPSARRAWTRTARSASRNVFRQETNTDFMLATKPRAFGDMTAERQRRRQPARQQYRSNGVYVRNLVVKDLYDVNNAAVTPGPVRLARGSASTRCTARARSATGTCCSWT